MRRRRERLEGRLREVQALQAGGLAAVGVDLHQEDIEDLEDSPESELEEQEERVLDQATAAQTIGELRSEIGTIKGLESAANVVLQSGGDTKWRELANLLGEIFTPQEAAAGIAEDSA